MKWSFKTFIIYFILFYVISYTWVGMEYVLDGKVNPSKASDMILAILCYLLTDKINQFRNNQIK